jgi:hypothetical protein
MLSEACKNHHRSGEQERRDEHSHRRDGDEDEQERKEPEETGDRKAGAGVRPIHEEDSTPVLGEETAAA